MANYPILPQSPLHLVSVSFGFDPWLLLPLRSKLAAEEKAKSAAVLVQPVVMVPETTTPLVSLLLADLLRTKLTPIEKAEYAVLLVQPIVAVPEAPMLAYPFILAAVGCPNYTLAKEEEGCRCCTAAAAYTLSTNGLPSMLRSASEVQDMMSSLANH
jgi:hypothetical protein